MTHSQVTNYSYYKMFLCLDNKTSLYASFLLYKYTMKKIPNEVFNCLKEVGLNQDEALVYYTLMKNGVNGATVRILNLALPNIERTTLYPILQRLINKNFVKEEKSSKTPKKAKNFVAISPTNLYSMILKAREQDLIKLKEKEPFFTQRMQNKYQKTKEYEIEEIDPFILPYVINLLKKEWIVIGQVVNKGLDIFGYDFFRLTLNPPNDLVSQKWNNGIQIYVLNSIITSKTKFIQDPMLDQEPLEVKYVLSQVERTVKEKFEYEFEKVEIKFVKDKKRLFKWDFFSYKFMIKPEDAKTFNEIFQSVVMSIENKIFFFWASTDKLLLEMIKSVLFHEKITIT